MHPGTLMYSGAPYKWCTPIYTPPVRRNERVTIVTHRLVASDTRRSLVGLLAAAPEKYTSVLLCVNVPWRTKWSIQNS